MTSKASICSVTLIVPMLEVINEPTFPAIIIEIKVGANSNIIDCLVANPTKYLGIKGFVMFNAVCIVITPPTKNDIKATMPNEPIIRSSMSFKIKCFITDHFVGLRNMFFTIKK